MPSFPIPWVRTGWDNPSSREINTVYKHKKHFTTLILGDLGSGKTSLLLKIWTANVPERLPTIICDPTIAVTIDNKEFEFGFKDTSFLGDSVTLRFLELGSKENRRLGDWWIADCILLCFAIDNHSSLEDVCSEWPPHLQTICAQKPIILVGVKADLRSTPSTSTLEQGFGMEKLVSSKDGYEAAEKIGAVAYIEFSSRSGKGVAELKQLMAKVTIKSEHMKRRTWKHWLRLVGV